MRSYDGFVGSVGNTPLIRLKGVSEETGCEILGKAEFLNPSGSVKDRAAVAIVLAAQADERLTETQVWRLRKQVDDASNRCDRLASVLGLGPSYRADIGVGAVRIVEAVADLMERPVTVGKMTEAFIDAESAE